MSQTTVKDIRALEPVPQNPAYHQATQRVIYGDTDLAGHVYYATYLRYFEVGRSELLRHAGATYAEWEKQHGVMLPVRHVEADYLGPARYDDLLAIHTWLTRASAVKVEFAYRLECEGAVIATGLTQHPVVEIATRKPKRVGLELLGPVGIKPIYE
jgi:acyl-CoA thioester hydrolase